MLIDKRKNRFYLLAVYCFATSFSYANNAINTAVAPINTAPIGYAEIRQACLKSLKETAAKGEPNRYETVLKLFQGLQLPKTSPKAYVNYDAGSLSQLQRDLEILAPKSSDSTANLASITDRTVSHSGWATYRHKLANPF